MTRRTLTVILAALALFAAALFLQRASAQAPRGCRPSATWPAAQRTLAQQVFALVNQHRTAMGLRALKTTRVLRRLATWKARNMAATNYFSHDDRTRSVWARFAACGVGSGYRGENIAFGYHGAQAVVQAWLASPGHRANIENPYYRWTGVAAAGSVLPYYVQDFKG